MKKYLLVCVTFILSIFSTPVAGKIYESLIGRKITGSFLSIRHPEYFEGFFMSLVFFSTLFIIIFGSDKKYKSLGLFMFIIVLFQIGQWESIIIDIGMAVIAWLLAQIVLLVRKKTS